MNIPFTIWRIDCNFLVPYVRYWGYRRMNLDPVTWSFSLWYWHFYVSYRDDLV